MKRWKVSLLTTRSMQPERPLDVADHAGIDELALEFRALASRTSALCRALFMR